MKCLSTTTWICLRCLENVKTYSPKWWFNDDLPRYKVENNLKQIKDHRKWHIRNQTQIQGDISPTKERIILQHSKTQEFHLQLVGSLFNLVAYVIVDLYNLRKLHSKV